MEYFATATVKWGPNPKTTCKKQHHEWMNELTLLTWYNRRARREIQTIQEEQIDTEMGYSFFFFCCCCCWWWWWETLVDCAAMVCAIANAQKTDTRGWFHLCVATAFSSSPGTFLPSFVISFPLLPFSFRLLLWSWKNKTKQNQTFSVRLQPFLFLF